MSSGIDNHPLFKKKTVMRKTTKKAPVKEEETGLTTESDEEEEDMHPGQENMTMDLFQSKKMHAGACAYVEAQTAAHNKMERQMEVDFAPWSPLLASPVPRND